MRAEKGIPPGYMTVGEIAKKMHVSVRTLQHYDQKGLLPPSSISEGGRRLYTEKDLLRLHQILSFKHLGFSLDDIKNRLIPLDTPREVADALTQQAAAIREKISQLSESLREIDALREEVLQIQAVDFKRYADIVVNLQMKNDFYWLIKHFDDPMMDHIRRQFDPESGRAFLKSFIQMQKRAIQLQQDNISPDSAEGQEFARAYWELIVTFTGGDMSMLPKLVALGQATELDPHWPEPQSLANAYIGRALDTYFSKTGVNPFAENRQ